MLHASLQLAPLALDLLLRPVEALCDGLHVALRLRHLVLPQRQLLPLRLLAEQVGLPAA
jgi:hypothetical protein